MNTCGFCGTEVQLSSSGKAYCKFCEMELFNEDIEMNGLRKAVPLFADPLLIDARSNTAALMEKDTLFLIKLLRLVREARKSAYNLMRVIRKGADQNPQFQADYTGCRNQYIYWSRKVWVIENILRERSAVFPVRITNDLLHKIAEEVEKNNQHTMTFSFEQTSVQGSIQSL